ncbi:MAG: hypothetical protein LBP78_07245 [Acidaminococcales bacterium]|jgi:hypothetical protein|nr:hypothetical protein [Acidaminococcales bacterium]
MKKAMFFIVLFFVFANVCGAAAYKNYEYNFQLDLPDDWQDIKDELEVENKGQCMFVIGKTGARQEESAFMTLLAYPFQVNELTLDDMSKRDKKRFADIHVKAIEEGGSDTKIKAVAFKKIGAHSALVITYEEDAASFARAIILENKILYIFYLAAGRSLAEHSPQFFKTIESLGPL